MPYHSRRTRRPKSGLRGMKLRCRYFIGMKKEAAGFSVTFSPAELRGEPAGLKRASFDTDGLRDDKPCAQVRESNHRVTIRSTVIP